MLRQKQKKMDGFVDSDYTMIASQIFDKIVNSIRDSGLNFSLQMSPFAATISLKKSLVKDKFGRSVKPSQMDSNSSDIIASLVKKNSDLENKIEGLELNLANARQDLSTANDMIGVITTKYQNDFRLEKQDKNLEQHLSEPELNQEDMLTYMGTTSTKERLEKLSVGAETRFATEDFRHMCKEDVKDEGSSILSAPEVSPNTLDHSYAIAMKVVAPCFPSIVSHWFPLPSDNSFNLGNLLVTPSMRSHYVRLPNPGDAFTSLEHLNHEFRELLRARRRGQDCRQS